MKRNTLHQQQFGFTSYTTEESDFLINYHSLQQELNNSVDLNTYGTSIEKIYFAFIAVPSNNLNHDEEISFKSSNKRLLIKKKLPYELVLSKTVSEIEKLMAQTFFLSLQHIEFLKIEDFKVAEFLTKIEQLFQQEGWLEKIQSS